MSSQMTDEQIKTLISILYKIFNDDSLKIAYTRETRNDIIDLQYITFCLNKIYKSNINDNNFINLIIKPITDYIYTAELNNYLREYTKITFNGKSIETIMNDLFGKFNGPEDLIDKIELIYNNENTFIEKLDKLVEFRKLDDDYKKIMVRTLFSEYATDLSNKILHINNLCKKINGINPQIPQIENEKLLNSYAKFLNNPILSNLIKVFDSQQRSKIKFKDITDWYSNRYPMIIMIKLMEYIIKHDFDEKYMKIFIEILVKAPTIKQILEVVNKCDNRFLQFELIPYVVENKRNIPIEFNGEANVLLPDFDKQNVINELIIIMNIKRIINTIEQDNYTHDTKSLSNELNKYTNKNDLMNYIILYGQLNSLLNSIDKFQKTYTTDIITCLEKINDYLTSINVDDDNTQLKQIILNNIQYVLQNQNEYRIIKCYELDDEKNISDILLLKIKLEKGFNNFNEFNDQCYSYICWYLYNITGNEKCKLYAAYFDMFINNDEINQIVFFNLFKKLYPNGNIGAVNKNTVINEIQNEAQQVVNQALNIEYNQYEILKRFLKNIYNYISNLTNDIERKIDELLFKYYHLFYDLYNIYCNVKLNEKIDDRLLIYYFKKLLNIVKDEF